MILPAAPILLLLAAALALLITHRLRPAFAYAWLVAASSAALTWGFLLATRSHWTAALIESPFISSAGFSAQFALHFDPLAWLFNFAITTILLSNLLTSLIIPAEPDAPRSVWNTYPLLLCLAAFSCLACCAGNLVSFLILWVFIDAIELVIWSNRGFSQTAGTSLALFLGIKAASLTILLAAAAMAIATGASTEFSSLPTPIVPLILIAGGLRLGVLPPYPSPTPPIAVQPIERPMLFSITAALAAILLVRVSAASTSGALTTVLMVLALLAVLSAGFSWLSKADLSANPGVWVQGSGAVLVISAMSGLKDAALGWGLALVLLGGLLFEYHRSNRLFRPLLWLGAISLTSLPFTLTWAGADAYSPPSFLRILLILGQSLLAAGFFRYSFRRTKNPAFPERWILPLYGIGLLLLVAVSLYLSVSVFPPVKLIFSDPLGNIDLLLPGLIVFACSSMILILNWVLPRSLVTAASYLARGLDFSWFYRILAFLFSSLSKFLMRISSFLEGSAGSLWAILMLVLLLTILQQIGLGG